MTKKEFLKELEDRLQMLDEKERKDMIEEYSQHISMRMESGMKEEEAIDDFGNINDLIAEILEAYHLDPEYEAKNKGSKIKNGVADLLPQDLFRKRTEKNERNVQKRKRRAQRSERFKANTKQKTSENVNVTVIAGEAVKTGENAISWSWDKVKKVCWLCVKIALLFLALPAVFFDLAGLFGLGLLLVMAFQGYPVFGAVIVAVGCVLSMTAYIVFLFTYIFKRRGAKA